MTFIRDKTNQKEYEAYSYREVGNDVPEFVRDAYRRNILILRDDFEDGIEMFVFANQLNCDEEYPSVIVNHGDYFVNVDGELMLLKKENLDERYEVVNDSKRV